MRARAGGITTLKETVKGEQISTSMKYPPETNIIIEVCGYNNECESRKVLGGDATSTLVALNGGFKKIHMLSVAAVIFPNCGGSFLKLANGIRSPGGCLTFSARGNDHGQSAAVSILHVGCYDVIDFLLAFISYLGTSSYKK